MKDVNLIPYILPNVLAISNNLSPTKFTDIVLPGLTPLFALRDPPQVMLTLLSNLTLLQNKTAKETFKTREQFVCFFGAVSSDMLGVLTLVYNALETETASVRNNVFFLIQL
jgi:SCY1-like protein 2